MNKWFNVAVNPAYGDYVNEAVAPSKIAFSIGTLDVAWYGIFFTLGFVFAILLACVKLEKWYKVSSTPFYWFVFIGIPVSLLGARLWSFIIGDASTLLQSMDFFTAFFDFRTGGLAIQGGVLFTVIAACIYFPLVLKKPKYNVKTKIGETIYVKQVSMWVYADAIIPCILVGQIIGRWGNFMNQEVYGPVVLPENIHSMDWLRTFMPAVWKGMFITDGPNADGMFHQPFFLYESFINFIFFIVLYVGGEFIKQRKTGDLGIAYFFFYGLLRLCMEPFRDGTFKFSFSIITSALFIVFSILFLIANHLIIAKNRQFKFWEYVVDYSKYQTKLAFFKIEKIFKKNKDIKFNHTLKDKKEYYRKDTEMYFYNSL